MLSNTCKYAIRAVIYLAVNEEEGKRIGIKHISKELDIPTPFLGKILQSLAKQKLLKSTKGPHGGFSIGKKPEDITLYDIVSIIDGEDVFTNCLIGLHSCKTNNQEGHACPVHDQYSSIRKQMTEFFKTESISKIMTNMEDKSHYIKL
ncbi:RrF2 family transcriptional regulator [Carboxylicivirga sp. N1Y90]|uniref:RrF2 family transcriptional regulator n=1 Tax=Carboxylicivirga fragile TaxID=3417571 RepID=UPI003D34CEFF|nr:Rrf2 family transcriptional regulator [Marinilabiliaceae bacterium N1Y90]